MEALVGEGKLTGMDAQPLTPVQHHRVHTYYTLIGLEVRFKGNDQDILCGFGVIAISGSPSQNDYELVANLYGMDKDLMESEQRLFFKQS